MRTSHLATKIRTVLLGITREGKNSLIKAKNLSNLYVFITQRLEGLLMDQHILKFYFSLSSYLKGQKAR